MEWMNGQNYEELPEFVESIPITQTRDYDTDRAAQRRTLPAHLSRAQRRFRIGYIPAAGAAAVAAAKANLCGSRF